MPSFLHLICLTSTKDWLLAGIIIIAPPSSVAGTTLRLALPGGNGSSRSGVGGRSNVDSWGLGVRPSKCGAPPASMKSPSLPPVAQRKAVTTPVSAWRIQGGRSEFQCEHR